MSKTDFRVLDLPRCKVGEGILWCGRTQALWWVDIGTSRVYRHILAINQTDTWEMPDKIGCLALTEGVEIVVALASGLSVLDPRNGEVIFLAGFPDMPSGHRPNDGAASPAGRLYVGTVSLGDRSRPDGVLYVFDPRTGVRKLMGGLHVANGLAFSSDGRTAYLSDSWPDVRTIWAFDHEPETGDLCRRRVFFDTAVNAGRPDGACMDADGYYWMAGVGGGEILRLSPSGQIDLRIDVPVERPSKPCFGGPDLRTLYVTSITAADDFEDGDGGAVLSMETRYRGREESRLNLTFFQAGSDINPE